MRRLALLVPVALLGFGLAPGSGPRAAAAQEKPTVAGSWTLNADRSDNARDRLNAAMRNQGSASAGASAGSGAASGGGSRSGGRRGGGGGGGGGGAGAATAGATGATGAAGAGEAQRGGGRRGTPASLILLQGPSEFTIRFTETTVIVDRGAGTPLELTTDGKAMKVGYVGAEVEYKAKWNGSKLEIETKLQAGPRIQETYELDKKDPAVMTVDVRFTDPSPQGNVNVHMKRVYDRS